MDVIPGLVSRTSDVLSPRMYLMMHMSTQACKLLVTSDLVRNGHCNHIR